MSSNEKKQKDYPFFEQEIYCELKRYSRWRGHK